MASLRRTALRFGSASALLAPWLAAGAQSGNRKIDGRVLDTRDRPVPFVTLTAKGVTATTDDSGHFQLTVASKDRVEFDVRRLGYTPTRMALAPGGDTTVSVLLLPGPAQLGAVEVTSAATKKSPMIAGFEDRMRERQRGAGTGTFLTAKDIENIHPMRTTAILEMQNSIFVRKTAVDQWAIYGKLGNGGECPANIFIDGVQMDGASDLAAQRISSKRVTTMAMVPTIPAVPVDQFLEPTDIAGIEIYPRGLLAPQQFHVADPTASRCATIVFWTKHG